MSATATESPAASATEQLDDTGQKAGTLNGITVYEKIANPMEAVGQLGAAIARSKMFGCPEGDIGTAQGRIIALTCLAQRITPLDFIRNYHIVGGKPVMQASAMLAEFRRRGGDHEVIERSPDKASVRVKYGVGRGQKSAEFSLTWDEAASEPWPWNKEAEHGKIPKRLKDGAINPAALKTNWATPRARANMLWARVISEAVRAMMPEVNSGIYTPEEVSDYSGIAYIPPEKPDAPVAVASAVVATAGQGEIVDAEYTVAPAAPQSATPAASPVASAPANAPIANPADPYKSAAIRPDQAEKLKALKAESGIATEIWKEWLSKCGVTSALQLTELQASDCVTWLEKVVAARKAQAVTDTSPAASNVTSEAKPEPTNPDPIRPDQIERLRSLNAELNSNEVWKAELAKYNVASAKALTALHATYFDARIRELIHARKLEAADKAKLEAHKAQQAATAAAAPAVASPVAEQPPFDAATATAPAGPVTAEQLAELKRLVTDTQIPTVEWQSLLAEYSATKAKELTSDRAVFVIDRLKQLAAKKQTRDEMSAWADGATVRGN